MITVHVVTYLIGIWCVLCWHVRHKRRRCSSALWNRWWR